MHSNSSERRSASVSPQVTALVIPKREPIDDDCTLTQKRRFGEHLTTDIDTMLSSKRQMATKKHQPTEHLPSKSINGRNGSADEQYKNLESHVSSNSPKTTSQKFLANGNNLERMTSALSPSSIPSKPR